MAVHSLNECRVPFQLVSPPPLLDLSPRNGVLLGTQAHVLMPGSVHFVLPCFSPWVLISISGHSMLAAVCSVHLLYMYQPASHARLLKTGCLCTQKPWGVCGGGGAGARPGGGGVRQQLGWCCSDQPIEHCWRLSSLHCCAKRQCVSEAPLACSFTTMCLSVAM